VAGVIHLADGRGGAGGSTETVSVGLSARGDAAPRVTWTLRLVLRVLVASAWAGLLVLAGVWCWSDLSGRLPTAAGLCRVMGLTLIAMGQFVFAAVVADRLCPGASAWVRTPTQVIAGATYLVGLVLLLLMLAGVIRQ
jgi:hypothetical protein